MLSWKLYQSLEDNKCLRKMEGNQWTLSKKIMDIYFFLRYLSWLYHSHTFLDIKSMQLNL